MRGGLGLFTCADGATVSGTTASDLRQWGPLVINDLHGKAESR